MKRLFTFQNNIEEKVTKVTTLNHLNHGFKPFEPNRTELVTPQTEPLKKTKPPKALVPIALSVAPHPCD